MANGDLSYILKVEDWEYPYFFGLQWQKDDADPFWESESIILHCRMVLPEHLSVTTASFTIWPMDELESSYRTKLKPKGYGWIEVRKGRFNANVHVPTSKLHPLMTAVAAGKIRYVDLSGTKVFRGRATIKHFSCWRDMDDESLEESRALWVQTTKAKRGNRRRSS